MRRHIHYEAAFEDYLRSLGWPYLPVDEHRKAIFSGALIKSFDFLVYPPGRRAWLADVKGRKFPYDGKRGRRYWENWVTRDDLEGLRRWRGVFGDRYEPMLVFAYWLLAGPQHEPTPEVHVFRNEYYAFLAVTASAYEAHARPGVRGWGTGTGPARSLRGVVAAVCDTKRFTATGRAV